MMHLSASRIYYYRLRQEDRQMKPFNRLRTAVVTIAAVLARMLPPPVFSVSAAVLPTYRTPTGRWRTARSSGARMNIQMSRTTRVALIVAVLAILAAMAAHGQTTPEQCNGGAGLWPASTHHWQCPGAANAVMGLRTPHDIGALRQSPSGSWEICLSETACNLEQTWGWAPFDGSLGQCHSASAFNRYGPGYSYGPGHCQHSECIGYMTSLLGRPPTEIEQGDCEHDKAIYISAFRADCDLRFDSRWDAVLNLCRPLAEGWCGDGTCRPPIETATNCRVECRATPPPDPFCGDGACLAPETMASCLEDCGPPPPPNPCPSGQICGLPLPACVEAALPPVPAYPQAAADLLAKVREQSWRVIGDKRRAEVAAAEKVMAHYKTALTAYEAALADWRLSPTRCRYEPQIPSTGRNQMILRIDGQVIR